MTQISAFDFFGPLRHPFKSRKDVANYIRKWRKNGAKIVRVRKGIFNCLSFFNIFTIVVRKENEVSENTK